MTALINASTSSGVVVTSDTSGSLAIQTNNTTALTIDTNQNLTSVGWIKFPVYTVSTLPAAGQAGRRALVSNALAPTILTAVVGGGAVTVPVFDNGSSWIVG